MQHIYRKTSMPKCDFNKVAEHFWITISEFIVRLYWIDIRCSIDMVCFPFFVSATHVRCQCHINSYCVESDEFNPGYKLRCVCIQKGKLCGPSCKCKNCSTQDICNHFGKPVSCMCGSTKKYDHYVACTNYEGQLRATICKCFKNKVGCNSNCFGIGCRNDYGKNLTRKKSKSPSMKQAKRENCK